MNISLVALVHFTGSEERMGVGDMQYDLSQGFNHGGRKAGFGRMNGLGL